MFILDWLQNQTGQVTERPLSVCVFSVFCQKGFSEQEESETWSQNGNAIICFAPVRLLVCLRVHSDVLRSRAVVHFHLRAAHFQPS